jgi:dihydroxyacid dehydratase/phosphogluconate dehydratase
MERFNELEREDAQPKKIVADQALGNAMLRRLSGGASTTLLLWNLGLN